VKQHRAAREHPAPFRFAAAFRRAASLRGRLRPFPQRIDRALEKGKPALFVVLDCGTNSHAEIAYLREQGIDVIVIDHHRSKESALDQGILINPHVHADETGAMRRGGTSAPSACV